MKGLLTLLCLLSCAVCADAQQLHLYGGNQHDEYLGCINCSSYDTNSIWNAYGKYGSSYNSKSIWNSYGKFGNPYNSQSPWNEYSNSNSQPVVVDKEGNFYGYLSANEYRSDRADFQLAEFLCKYHSVIAEDVSKWARKLRY